MFEKFKKTPAPLYDFSHCSDLAISKQRWIGVFGKYTIVKCAISNWQLHNALKTGKYCYKISGCNITKKVKITIFLIFFFFICRLLWGWLLQGYVWKYGEERQNFFWNFRSFILWTRQSRDGDPEQENSK